MSIQNISNELVSLLSNKQFVEVQKTFFDNDVISLEPMAHPNPKTEGLAAILKKEMELMSAIAHWHKLEISSPVVAGHHFCISMNTHFTLKNGREITIDELIVYTVKGHKIVMEQFFY